MQKKILVSVPMIFMLVFSLLLSGCGAAKAPGPAGNKSAAAPPAQSNSNEVVIGAVASLTGVNAETGEAQEWAYKRAVADVNAAGGLTIDGKKMPVKLIFADDTSTTSGAAAAAESLIKVNGAKLLLSTNTDPMNIALGTVAEKYKVYLAMNTCVADAAAAQHWKWVSDMFFTTTAVVSVPFEIWNSLSAAARPKRIALLMMDNSDGQAWVKTIEALNAKKFHYNIALNEPFTPGSKDFSSEILKMKSMNIDSVLFLGAPTDGITIVRQAKQLKFEPEYFIGWMGLWPVAVAQALGPESNYLIHDGFWSQQMPYPGAAKLGQEYEADHNGMSSVNIGLPYACAQVLFKAIENANSTDPAKVRDATFGHEFDGTVLGNIKFNAGAIAATPSILLQWYNQKRYLLWPKFTSVNWQIHAFNTGAVLH